MYLWVCVYRCALPENGKVMDFSAHNINIVLLFSISIFRLWCVRREIHRQIAGNIQNDTSATI